jgi:predicted adenylyl cyclase CyaB
MASSIESRSSDSAVMKTFSGAAEVLGEVTSGFDTAGFPVRTRRVILTHRKRARETRDILETVDRNIEVKAQIASVAALLPRVRSIADHGPEEIRQHDTYFACPSGRLKLRRFSATAGELIYYQRVAQHAPKESRYLRAPTSAPDALRAALALAYGETAHIDKQRTLFVCGRTRIHLDQVAQLGQFLELEVVLEDGEPAAAGVREAHELLRRLGVEAAQLIDGGYLDLLARPAIL